MPNRQQTVGVAASAAAFNHERRLKRDAPSPLVRPDRGTG
jgi:hypothetical protein